MIRRWWTAFRVAFWSACHAETSRRTHALHIELQVHTEQAMQALQELEDRVDAVSFKVEYAARQTGRLH